MNQPPAFLLYADDFIGGTADLTAEEVGIYMRLLCHSWNRKGIENDEVRIGILVGQCAGNAVASAMEVLRRKFEMGPDNRWRNARQEAVRAARENYSATQSAKAKHRWECEKSAAGDKKPGSAQPKLTPLQRELARRFERCLNGQWVNDAGKWITRLRRQFAKCAKVVAEVENAMKEARVKTTPAQYAEQIWKEFAD